IDVRRAITHQSIAVTTEVGDPNVITPDHQDIRPVARLAITLRHDAPSRDRCVLRQDTEPFDMDGRPGIPLLRPATCPRSTLARADRPHMSNGSVSPG